MLHELDLSSNKLSELILPENLGILNQLTTLLFRHNDLVCLPSALSQLASLTRLDVRNNMLLSLPRQLVFAVNILDACSNPMLDPPVEVCEAGLHRMRAYFRDRNHSSPRSLWLPEPPDAKRYPCLLYQQRQ